MHILILGPYCGTTAPAAIVIQGRIANISFISDDSDNYSGFQLTYFASCKSYIISLYTPVC